jgi:hypothetical protein
MIRVDGISYRWMGQNIANTEAVTQTASTRSIFTMDVNGTVAMTATFLSPIFPDDEQRQSLVFSYLEVEVHATDGKPHNVELYSDISGGM